MGATSISIGLLITLLLILLLDRMRRLKQIAGFRVTEDVPVLRIDHISTKGILLGVW